MKITLLQIVSEKKKKTRDNKHPTDDGSLMTFPFSKFLFGNQVNEVYKVGFEIVTSNSGGS